LDIDPVIDFSRLENVFILDMMATPAEGENGARTMLDQRDGLFFSLFQAAIFRISFFCPQCPILSSLSRVYISFMNGSVTGSSVGFISGCCGFSVRRTDRP
jgi:hypothetical protein